MRARIRSIEPKADGITAYRLEPVAGERLPPFSAGAHIDVKLAPGLSRSYSLFNDPAEADVFAIAVQHAGDSRGGSRFIHENWSVGHVVEFSGPVNHFPLNENAPHTVLIAGGIGVTPMLPMIASLERLGRSWELHYVATTPARAAFADELQARPQARVVFDQVADGEQLDIAGVIAAAEPESHFYCCGPNGMLAAFSELTAGFSPERVHVERFSADAEVASDGEYDLVLARSGRTISVEEGQTMLDALLDAGVNVGFACSEGVCGSCRVKVLEGVPDHRDNFLTPEEKRSNSSIMVCCSGSLTKSLTLDV